MNSSRERLLNRRAALGLDFTGIAGAGLLLAGCGSSDDNKESSGSNTSPAGGGAASSGGSKKTVEITYWGSFSGNLGDAEKAVVDKFNTSQSDVKVNYQFQGTYEETA